MSKIATDQIKLGSAITAARCHEVQTTLGQRDVPEFDQLVLIGMAVRVALHIRGLPLIEYEILKLVCNHYLDIPSTVLPRILALLSEIEFVYLTTKRKTIKSVLPNVPYYDDLYRGVGDYIDTEASFTEQEQLALAIVNRLAAAPDNSDRLQAALGADQKLYRRNIQIGLEGGFLVVRRHRGRDIIINPVYFSENAEIFADHVAATNSADVAQLLSTLKQHQGWPLELIKANARIDRIDIKPDQLILLERLAQEGMIKPPAIATTYSGKNHFLFTPTPTAANLSPLKREIHERAMAIVSAVRQGQLLPQQYSIRSPAAVISALRRNLRLSRATTEFSQQYKSLVRLRIGQLIHVGNDYYEFRIIDTEENKEALDMAYSLVTTGEYEGLEVDDEARRALLQSDPDYVESLVAAEHLRQRESVSLTEEQEYQLSNLLLKVTS